MRGNKVIGACCISHRISHNMDTEIPVSRPESWSEGVSGKTVSESDGRVTGLRDSQVQHTTRSYTHGDDYPAQICGKYSSWENKRDDEQ